MSVRQASRVKQAHKLLGRMLKQLSWAFRYALLEVLLVILLSTVVFKFFYVSLDIYGQRLDLDWVTAFYFAVSVITTTGFGDFHFANQHWALQLFGIFAM